MHRIEIVTDETKDAFQVKFEEMISNLVKHNHQIRSISFSTMGILDRYGRLKIPYSAFLLYD
jgi:hypothetical protein